MRPDFTFIPNADSNVDNESFLGKLASDAEILDCYHASVHLAKVSEFANLRPTGLTEIKLNFRINMVVLLPWPKPAHGLCFRVKGETTKKEHSGVLEYIKTHQHRTNYAALKEKSLPMGSVIIEATNKTLLPTLMNRSGMHWGLEGGQAVLSFSSLRISNWFDYACIGLWRKLITGTRALSTRESIMRKSCLMTIMSQNEINTHRN